MQSLRGFQAPSQELEHSRNSEPLLGPFLGIPKGQSKARASRHRDNDFWLSVTLIGSLAVILIVALNFAEAL